MYPNMAYHLSVGRFNEFLRTLCAERDVPLVDDRITDVETNADGTRIAAVHGASGATYEADLYVDSTGFKRLLMNELDATYRSFDIPLDTAVRAAADRPLGDRSRDRPRDGRARLVLADRHLRQPEPRLRVQFRPRLRRGRALAALRAHRDEDLGEVSYYRFDSGFYEDPWVGNCVATGNAQGFIEPLQATSLTTHLNTALRLSRRLAARGGSSTTGSESRTTGTSVAAGTRSTTSSASTTASPTATTSSGRRCSRSR